MNKLDGTTVPQLASKWRFYFYTGRTEQKNIQKNTYARFHKNHLRENLWQFSSTRFICIYGRTTNKSDNCRTFHAENEKTNNSGIKQVSLLIKQY